MKNTWPFLIVFASPMALAGDPFADPFADPFTEEAIAIEDDIHQSRVELKSYYQNNNLRSNHPLNPGLSLFNDDTRFVGLDASLESNWSDQWSTRGRVYSRYMVGSSDLDNSDRYDTYLLEGLLQWQSLDQNLVIELGRKTPKWSNGYNYDIANMLTPNRNLPNIDQDNPLQAKGWDMLSAQYYSGHWSLAGYLVKSDSESPNIDREAVVRLGYQNDHEFSFLVHKLDEGKLAYGATFSTLLGDETTFRAEWTRHPYRQLNLLDGQERSHYQRLVLGTTYAAVDGWSLTGEFFYNQHGASDSQWQQITTLAASSADLVRTGQSQNIGFDINQALAGIGLMGQGWSRQRYGSLMFMSEQSEDLWQLRLGTQISLDDSSKLHRIEVLKSINDNLSARLELQLFEGCDLCEFGLNPSQNNLRLTASWLF